MNSYLKLLIERVENLDNSIGFETLFANVENILSSINIDLLKFDLSNLSKSEFDIIANNSKEASTHFKWQLHKGQKWEFEVRIHEFKTENQRREGYANTIHNHRYWFSSIILKGGYSHKLYNKDVFSNKDFTIIENKQLAIGDGYSLNPNDVHTISNVKENTVSLVIISKPIREYSTSMNLMTKEIVNHVHFTSRYEEFKNLL